jgi:hypothetical protein
MWSKRDFVKGAAAIVTAGVVVPGRGAVAVGLRAAAVPAPGAPAVSPESAVDVVVFNDWFEPAHAFAAGLSKQGVRALQVQGDAGKLWYDTLRGLVAGGRGRRIAGMTTHTDLFILETLARDQGLKVRRRDSVSGGRLVSWVLS